MLAWLIVVSARIVAQTLRLRCKWFVVSIFAKKRATTKGSGKE